MRIPTRPILAGALAVLLGASVAPALASGSAPAGAAAHAGHHRHRATTTVKGFAATPAAVRLGGTVVDKVSVRPRGHRLIRVQARRPGGTKFVTVSTGHSTKSGDFLAAYRPATLGTWRFRLLVPATKHAGSRVTPSRAVTATLAPTGDTTPPGIVTGVRIALGTGSDVTLSWTNPTDPDFTGVVIRRAVGPTAPASPTDGVLVTQTGKAATSYTDTALAGDTTYSYTLFTVDTASNISTGVVGSAKTGAVTQAVLSLNDSTGPNAKQTVNQSQAFVIAGTQAGKGLSLVSGTLDYGDGTSESFSGDPTTWAPTPHQYDSTGSVTARLTVVDSASMSVSTSLTIQLFIAPTATIVVDPANPPLKTGTPVTFDVTASTPPGTSFIDFDYFSGPPDFTSGQGAPPSTFQLTFATAGTYVVTVEADNDAGGFATDQVSIVIP